MWENPWKKVMVLGARKGGTHIIETLHPHCTIEGVYDQDCLAPGLDRARRLRIPVYAGSWSLLRTMLLRCEEEPDTMFFVFLPSRDWEFIKFAKRRFTEVEQKLGEKNINNMRLLQMDVDFSDYEPLQKLRSIMGDKVPPP